MRDTCGRETIPPTPRKVDKWSGRGRVALRAMFPSLTPKRRPREKDESEAIGFAGWR